MASKYTINDLQYFAEIKNGKCLSREYKDLYSPLEWRCKIGHRFSLAFALIRQGAWCIQCEKKQVKLEILQEFAKKQGGKCLSDEFVNTNTKFKWQCKFGHTWKTKASNILNGYSWCQTCSGNITHTLQEFQEIARSKKGKCLSEKFVNGQTPMTWQCEKKHIWKNRGAKILAGQWCRKCWVNNLSEKYREKISVLQKFAESKGGKLLSKKYINANIPVKWQCSNKHIWMATPSVIKKRYLVSCLCKGKTNGSEEMKKFIYSLMID